MGLKINFEEISNNFPSLPLIDVRSPGEFLQGHIPGAINIPLFTNEERAKVGTCYKQQGKETAIKLGLEIVGPKLKTFVLEAERIAPDKQVMIHCWRGGMRSSSFAWLLETAGFKQVFTLEKGYKGFRNWVLEQFGHSYDFRILGGYTGSGKTEILHKMADAGAVTIDLEGLAHHKGSAFGGLGETPQPTQEQFENALAIELYKKREHPIWIEDESRCIGTNHLPNYIYTQKMEATLHFIDADIEDRIKTLVRNYGQFTKEDLAIAIAKIKKKMGPQHAKAALESLEQDNLADVARTCLHYYDKAYDFVMNKRSQHKVRKYENSPNLIEQLIHLS